MATPTEFEGLSKPPLSAPEIAVHVMAPATVPLEPKKRRKGYSAKQSSSSESDIDDWNLAWGPKPVFATGDVPAEKAAIRERRKVMKIIEKAAGTKGCTFQGFTPEGYIAYRTPSGDIKVTNVPKKYLELSRPRVSKSTEAVRSGRGLCMCRALGLCPLTAFLHQGPCELCNDPIIDRYYPTDGGWWDLRAQVKKLRCSAQIEDEIV